MCAPAGGEMSVKLPDSMTYCKARMLDAQLYGRTLESEMFGRIIDELARHNALRDAVAWERECEAFWNENTATTCDGAFEVEDNLEAARAEVDRLLEEK